MLKQEKFFFLLTLKYLKKTPQFKKNTKAFSNRREKKTPHMLDNNIPIIFQNSPTIWLNIIV